MSASPSAGIRDYADVSPVDGVIVGARKQKLAVAVDVLPVERAETGGAGSTAPT